jgi:hypothetical protein
MAIGPRRHPRYSRAVLFWCVVTFLAVQLAAGLLLDYRWPLLRFPSAARVMATVRRQPAPPDLVFLGSSRFAAGIDPGDVAQLLERDCRLPEPVVALNASVPAGDVVTADFLLRRLLREGARPRAVVVEVSPETLNLYNEWLNFHIRRQLRWDDLPAYLLDICRVRQGFYLLSDRLCPLYIHRLEVWGALARLVGVGPAVPDGGVPERRAAASEPVDWDQLLRPPERAMTRELWDLILFTTDRLPGRWLRRFRVGGTATAALERLLRACRDEGIRVVLVGVPVSSPHRKLYVPAIDEPFLAYVQQVAAAHGCQFIDYRGRVPDTLFLDNHHLCPAGQAYFDRLLVHEVLTPLWRQRQGTDSQVSRLP